MSRVEEIKAAIDQFSPEERCELAALLNPVEEDDWERQIKKDACSVAIRTNLSRSGIRISQIFASLIRANRWTLRNSKPSLLANERTV
jgi:hypothetical protein